MSPSIELRIMDMPQVLASMRREIAKMLRDEAEGEPDFVERKLREIAARFESGLPKETT